MRFVFVGATKFGLKCLERCLKLEHVEVCGIVTAPEQFKISYSDTPVHNVLHTNFSEIADRNGIEIAELVSSMDDKHLWRAIERWQPDAFIVVGWYHMIPKKWRNIADAYGLHASLLPKYSGGAPLVWAMINAEKETGITLFKMEDGVDNGPIIAQAATCIDISDDINSLYGRIEKMGIQLIQDSLPLIALKKHNLIQQNDEDRTIWPQRSPQDGLINIERSAFEINNFVRAQTKPYPGAFLIVHGTKIHVWKTKVSHIKGPAGTFSKSRNAIIIFCSCGTGLELTDITLADKPLSAEKFWTEYIQKDSKISVS